MQLCVYFVFCWFAWSRQRSLPAMFNLRAHVPCRSRWLAAWRRRSDGWLVWKMGRGRQRPPRSLDTVIRMVCQCLGWENTLCSLCPPTHPLFSFRYDFYINIDFYIFRLKFVLVLDENTCFLHLSELKALELCLVTGCQQASSLHRWPLCLRWLSRYWSKACSALLCFT